MYLDQTQNTYPTSIRKESNLKYYLFFQYIIDTIIPFTFEGRIIPLHKVTSMTLQSQYDYIITTFHCTLSQH